MNKPAKRFLIEIPFPLILSQLLIITGGIEMGLTFRSALVSLGFSIETLNPLTSSLLPLGLVLNGFLIFRAHALLKRIEKQ